MTSVNSITRYNNEVCRRNEIKQADQRHADALQEQQRIKQRREATEAQRIEENRRMNRSGQNVDRMA